MKKRNVGFDFIRILSIFLVVVIHSNVAYLATDKGTVGWHVIMLCTSLCLVAVPLFFMVSGALLLDTNDVISIKDLFFKRILKQALPFLVWSLVYVVARIIMGKISFSFSAFSDLLHQPAYYQFWFMYSLFAIYLLLPILQVIVLKLEKKHIEYLLIIWIVFSTLFPMLQKFLPGFAISSHVDLILCEGYIGYFLLGYYLKKYHAKISAKKSLPIAFVGLFLTGLSSVIEYNVCTNKAISYQGYFYQTYLTPFVAIAVIGLFLFFQNAKFSEKGKSLRALRTGAELSIGVFYIHMLILTLVESFGLIGDSNVLVLVAKIVIVYSCSYLLSFVISKIPFVNKVLMGIEKIHEN